MGPIGHCASRSCLLTLFLLLAGAGTAIGMQSRELLENGSFEAAARAAGWMGNRSKSTTMGVVEGGKDGKRAYRIEVIQDDALGYLRQERKGLTVPKGTTIRLGGWYRTSEGIIWGEKPLLQVYSWVNFHTPKTRQCVRVDLDPSSKWRPFEARITLKHDMEQYLFLVKVHHAKGEFLFDGLSLAALDPKEELTLFSLKQPPPVLDGDLSDACWQGAQRALGFLVLGELKPESAEADTEVMSVYDDERVYFAVRVHEPSPSRIKERPNMPWGDCIELFIDPKGTGAEYYHLAVDPKGETYAAINRGSEEEISLAFTAKGRVLADHWAVELALPFEQLGARTPKDNARWAFNVGRERFAGKKPEFSTWARLGAFTQRSRFGKLAFYSRQQIEADMEYWRRSDADPLMRRRRVNGIEIARAGGKDEWVPDLWTNYPFRVDRRDRFRNYAYRGLKKGVKEKYPDFYRTCMAINEMLVAKSLADERLNAVRRAATYVGRPGSPQIVSLVARSGKLDSAMNAIYQRYGRAFRRDRATIDKVELAAIRIEAKAVRAQIEELARPNGRPDPLADLRLPLGDRRPNANGVPDRFLFNTWGSAPWGVQEATRSLGPFENLQLGWPGSAPTVTEAGAFTYPSIVEAIHKQLAGGITKRFNAIVIPTMNFMCPKGPALTRLIETDDGVLARSQDGLRAAELNRSPYRNVHLAVNPNHFAVQKHVEKCLETYARTVTKEADLDFFLTTWEGRPVFTVEADGKRQTRLIGYQEPSKQAFRAYLKERYATIATLNAKWRTNYARFDAIEPPSDKHIEPAETVSGLTYEFERWQRVNYIRYVARAKRALKRGAPGVPVMADPSSFLLNMSTYLMFTEDTCDILSHHSNPAHEDAVWANLQTMNRGFGRAAGYHENYWAMRRNPFLNEERPAKAEVSKFFYVLATHDLRHTCWPQGYMPHETPYVVAYGGGTFQLVYDQTIYRWSTTALPAQFEKIRSVERALLDSHAPAPKTAIIQPCSTVLNQAAAGLNHLTSPTVRQMFELHNQLLAPHNVPDDYLPEEMVLAGQARLEDYTVLLLPPAQWMSAEFARKLAAWTEQGGTLIALGPFALEDPFGFALPSETSLCRRVFPKLKRTGPGAWDFSTSDATTKDAPALLERPVGRGRLIYLTRPVDVFLRNPDLRAQLLRLIEANADRPATARHPDLRLRFREGPRADALLVVCNYNPREVVAAPVTIHRPVTEARDLCTPTGALVPLERKGKMTQLTVRLEPGEWTVIRLREPYRRT